MMGMLSCREVTRLVSQGLDRELGFRERIALRAHFMICRSCRSFEDQLELLRQAVRQMAEEDGEAGGKA